MPKNPTDQTPLKDLPDTATHPFDKFKSDHISIRFSIVPPFICIYFAVEHFDFTTPTVLWWLLYRYCCCYQLPCATFPCFPRQFIAFHCFSTAFHGLSLCLHWFSLHGNKMQTMALQHFAHLLSLQMHDRIFHCHIFHYIALICIQVHWSSLLFYEMHCGRSAALLWREATRELTLVEVTLLQPFRALTDLYDQPPSPTFF